MSTYTDAEKKLLFSSIDASINYLEFGSGESTVYASRVPTIKTITSVESSKQYVEENLTRKPSIARALSTGKLSFHFVDIGETIFLGNPKDTSKKHLWPNYSLSVFHKKSEHDVCLIDGRFRVACTLNCILNAPDNCTILIHDFWDRPKYHIVLKFLTVENKVDTLGIFKKKEQVNRDLIKSLIQTYQYLPEDVIAISDKAKITLARLFNGRFQVAHN